MYFFICIPELQQFYHRQSVLSPMRYIYACRLCRLEITRVQKWNPGEWRSLHLEHSRLSYLSTRIDFGRINRIQAICSYFPLFHTSKGIEFHVFNGICKGIIPFVLQNKS